MSGLPSQRAALLGRRFAIAALCLVAQLSGIAHLFLVEHRRCAEHGEAIHGDAALAAAPTPDGDDSGHALAMPARGAATAGEDHDHCQWLSERRDRGAVDSSIVVCAPPAVGELAYVRVEPPVVTRPRYRLAPKTSPPLAA